MNPNIVHASTPLRNLNDNTVCETAKETQMYRTVFWTLWEREWGMIWENGIETCTVSYKKRIASPGSMQDTGSLGLVHWDDPEGFSVDKHTPWVMLVWPGLGWDWQK